MDPQHLQIWLSVIFATLNKNRENLKGEEPGIGICHAFPEITDLVRSMLIAQYLRETSQYLSNEAGKVEEPVLGPVLRKDLETIREQISTFGLTTEEKPVPDCQTFQLRAEFDDYAAQLGVKIESLIDEIAPKAGGHRYDPRKLLDKFRLYAQMEYGEAFNEHAELDSNATGAELYELCALRNAVLAGEVAFHAPPDPLGDARPSGGGE